MELVHQAALVVGGSSGLGRATAERLRAEDCDVILVGRDVKKGETVAEALGAQFCRADVRDTEALVAALDVAESRGTLRAVVHCAGIGHAARTTGQDDDYDSAHPLEDFRRVVDLNLVGTFNVLRLAATAMGRSEPDGNGQRGAIVVASSLAARVGQTGQAAYAASKAGQLGLLQPVARDLSTKGIRLNAISPGGVDTPIYGPEGVPAKLRDKVAGATVFPHRMAYPEEFATLAIELLRNDYLNAVNVDLAAGTVQLPR